MSILTPMTTIPSPVPTTTTTLPSKSLDTTSEGPQFPDAKVFASHRSGHSVTDQPSQTGLQDSGLLGKVKGAAVAAKEKLENASKMVFGTSQNSKTDDNFTSAGLPKMMKALTWAGPGKIECSDVPTPTLGDEKTGRMEHAAILKVVATAICGSDLHMYRGTANTKKGLVLGHEITGEVVEVGRDVLYIKKGDLVSVPFPVSCGRCLPCKEGKTSVCTKTCLEHPGAIYGYASMGDWRGGQAEYFLAPYADFNLLKIPDKEKGMKRILDIAMLADVLPTAFHGAVSARVSVGKTVYIAGAGPIGIACAASCFMLGAAKVIVGDPHPERLKNARTLGCSTVDTSSKIPLTAQIATILGNGLHEVDCAVDCVGYECVPTHKEGATGNMSADYSKRRCPEQVLTDCGTVCKAGGSIGVPGAYFPTVALTPDAAAKYEKVSLAFGELWNKSLSINKMGQCPVHNYNYDLLQMILTDRIKLSEALNTKVIDLADAPKAYEDLNHAEAVKYVIDPHHMIRN